MAAGGEAGQDAVRVFEAHYPGVCQVCDEPIQAGQLIRLAGADHRGYRHDVCPELVEPERPGFLAPRTTTDEMGY